MWNEWKIGKLSAFHLPNINKFCISCENCKLVNQKNIQIILSHLLDLVVFLIYIILAFKHFPNVIGE